jgi:hypothetical protein
LDKVPVPSVVVPSWNVTVPVGVPVAGSTAETVAVKVTDWPGSEGFWDDVRASDAILVDWTTWERAVELAAGKLLPPE